MASYWYIRPPAHPNSAIFVSPAKWLVRASHFARGKPQSCYVMSRGRRWSCERRGRPSRTVHVLARQRNLKNKQTHQQIRWLRRSAGIHSVQHGESSCQYGESQYGSCQYGEYVNMVNMSIWWICQYGEYVNMVKVSRYQYTRQYHHAQGTGKPCQNMQSMQTYTCTRNTHAFKSKTQRFFSPMTSLVYKFWTWKISDKNHLILLTHYFTVLSYSSSYMWSGAASKQHTVVQNPIAVSLISSMKKYFPLDRTRRLLSYQPVVRNDGWCWFLETKQQSNQAKQVAKQSKGHEAGAAVHIGPLSTHGLSGIYRNLSTAWVYAPTEQWYNWRSEGWQNYTTLENSTKSSTKHICQRAVDSSRPLGL